MSSEKVEGRYIAIIGYNEGIPRFGKTVFASDRVSAMVQFDLIDEYYTDVMPYVADDQLYVFDDGESKV